MTDEQKSGTKHAAIALAGILIYTMVGCLIFGS